MSDRPLPPNARRFTIPMRGTVTAGSTLILISRRLDFRYRTEAVRLNFELNTNRTVAARLFVSDDAGTTSDPNVLGQDFFATFAIDTSIVGDDQDIDLLHSILVDRDSTWIKVLLTNSDGFDHAVDVFVTVIPLEDL